MMQRFPGQDDVACAGARCELAALPRVPEAGQSLPLALETAVVTIGTVTAIRFLNARHISDLTWLAIPCLLVTAASLPSWLRKDAFPSTGLDRRHIGRSLVMVSVASLCTFPAVFLGLWLVARMGLPIPLRPAIIEPHGWLSWLVYQFLYVAVAEELFFRGYVQANVMRLVGGMRHASGYTPRLATILISAGCFALAHVVVQGQAASLLTFLPGLVLAWLFIRTDSLLAPVLFHGLANVFYSSAALTFS